MPFEDEAFDGAYSMNVSMNIADKRAFYREVRRVLRPGGWLALSEVAQGPGGDPDYPLPWAATAASSFLATPEDTRAELEAAGFRVESLRNTSAEARDFAARSRAIVEAGGNRRTAPSCWRLGERAREAVANNGRAAKERRTLPIEIVCRKV